MPIIREYASECSHITEFGVGEGYISSAILTGTEGKEGCIIRGYDIIATKNAKNLSKQIDRWGYFWGDSLLIEIEDTELLVIDTIHNANYIWGELYDNGKHVSKYILVIGTNKWGEKGETEGHLGLWSGIEKYITEIGGFKVKEVIDDGYGLTVLEKI